MNCPGTATVCCPTVHSTFINKDKLIRCILANAKGIASPCFSTALQCNLAKLSGSQKMKNVVKNYIPFSWYILPLSMFSRQLTMTLKSHRLPGAPVIIHQDTYPVFEQVQNACTDKTSTTTFMMRKDHTWMSRSQRVEATCVLERLDLTTSPVSLKWARILRMLLGEISEYIAVSSMDIVDARRITIHWILSGTNSP